MSVITSIFARPYCTRGALVCTPALILFILALLKMKVISDYTAGDYSSLLTRIMFVTAGASAFSWITRHYLNRLLPEAICQSLLVLFFLAVILFPAMSQPGFFRKSFRDVTRHLLKQKQALSQVVREYPGTYQHYFTQHFSLPRAYIHLNALVKIYLLGVSPNTNVAVGRNGFYFEGWGARKVEKGIVENFDNIADYMGQIPFQEKELRQWKRALEERWYWLKEKGSQYVFVLAPTKAFVYPEFLPDQLQGIRGRTRYEQLSDYLHAYTDLPFIDVLPSLLEAKRERDYPLLFYKTDFHWNFYGAFVVYQAIVKELRSFFPHYTFPLPNYADFTLRIDEHWAHHRFMNMIGLPEFMHKNEHYLTLIPKKGGLYDSASDLPPDGIYDVYPPERTITAPDGSGMKIRMIKNPEAPVPSLALLGDSFLEKCVYFFSANAQQVFNYRTVVNFPDNIFYFEQPDIVIQEILNMFILRRPPKNPSDFQESYLRGKFADSRDTVVYTRHWKYGSGKGYKEEEEVSCQLRDVPRIQQGEVQVARVLFHAPVKKQIKVTLSGKGGNIFVRKMVQGKSGETECYIEMPLEPVDLISLEICGEEHGKVELHSLEIRSDAHERSIGR